MRRGQFYMIDAFFAAAILFLGIGFVISDAVSVPEPRQARVVSNDITSLLYETPLADIDDDWVREHYVILDETYSPLQQAHAWIYNASEGCTWCLANASALVGNLSEGLVPPQFGFSVRWSNETDEYVLYLQDPGNEPEIMLVSQDVILTESAGDDFLGPDLLEVRIWE